MHHSQAGWLSRVGMALSLGIILAAVAETLQTRSARYWPLLIIGLIIGCVSTPFYYYFKAKDRSADPYGDVAINTLNELGRQRTAESKAEESTRHGA